MSKEKSEASRERSDRYRQLNREQNMFQEIFQLPQQLESPAPLESSLAKEVVSLQELPLKTTSNTREFLLKSASNSPPHVKSSDLSNRHQPWNLVLPEVST